jgi:arylsulfatase A-like enzyme
MASGIETAKIQLPQFYPDEDVIKQDLADYYFEVNRFDRDVGRAIQILDSIGELDNTIIVVTGDHGMPFPRCKGNLYDMGVRVPLVVYWGSQIKDTGKISSMVSLTDLAPTFLELAGVEVPGEMTGNSLTPLLMGDEKVRKSAGKSAVVFGRERHVPAQLSPSMAGYPSRAIRTQDYLYIHNFFLI